MNFKDQAQHFLEEEKQFHLGDLVTEKSHPKTVQLSSKIEENTMAGVKLLLEVDHDIYPVAKTAFASSEYDLLIDKIQECVLAGNTVCFSSCGASGRLAIILESMWRTFWQEESLSNKNNRDRYNRINNQVFSIMTGGDRALIRSVENFEDYQVFGRRQFAESGLGNGDLLIALTEGGEISSVIGSMKEGLDRGANVVMVYNNPTEILEKKFQRSREMLNHPGVLKINLTTGPMSLAGSTRLQATTIAMLVVGAALEESFNVIINSLAEPGQSLIPSAEPVLPRSSYADQYLSLLSELEKPNSISSIAKLIDIEHDCYTRSGKVTYVADRFLLDIFSDTTERAPTFMLPPFRQFDDNISPEPWAFAKDPLRNSEEAWVQLLKREPRGLSWTKNDYQDMKVPLEIQDRDNLLDKSQIIKFHIGRKAEESRENDPNSVLLRISVNESFNSDFRKWWEDNSEKYSHAVHMTIGDPGEEILEGENINIPLNLPASSTSLFAHLAVKMIFNIISTGTMAKLGRIKGNWMIQLDATNKKLTDRAIRIISHFAQITYSEACLELFRTMADPENRHPEHKNSYVVQTLNRLGM